MSAPSQRLPKYRHYKPKNLAAVRIAGRDVYLGRYDSPESREKYRRVLAEWLATGATPSPLSPRQADGEGGPSVNEVMVGYVRHVDGYYLKNGKPTSEAGLIKLALRTLKLLYGHTPAKDFGPLALKAVRRAFVDSGLCRNEVNRRTGLVVRFFKWAVENEFVPPSLHHGLKAVAGLRKGRTEVRESKPVRPVTDDRVDLIRTHVARQVWAMVEIQRLTGARPGEVVIMRTADLDRSGPVWVYTPGAHKTEHHGKARTICLGPRAQEVVRPWLRADPAAYLFQPAEAVAEALEAKREARKTRVQPSQRCRKKAKPRKVPGDAYTVASYRRAIAYGCRRAGVPAWGPNRLRHNAATAIRKECGLDAARAVLGHGDVGTTEVYAERDQGLASAAMERLG